MGVRNLVSICRSTCTHPLIVCAVFISIWLYGSFPLLFSLLVQYCPVIASTLLLLGTLLYYGDIANEHKIGEQKYHVNPMNVNHSYKFGSYQSRGNNNNNYNTSDEDNIVKSLSPSGSVADIYAILDELGPLSESDVPFPNVSTDQSHESTEYVNETDDDKESVVTWTGEEQRDVAGSERKQVLENLIARQRTLKNMRILAEQNMVIMSPHLQTKNENNIGFVIPRRYSYDPSGHKPDRVGPTFQTDSPRRHSFDPSRHRLGLSFQSDVRPRHERFDTGPTFQTISPRRHSSDRSRHRVGPTLQSNVPRRHERFDVGPTFQTDPPRRHSFDPSRHRVGPAFQSSVPRHHERFDAGPTFQAVSPRRHSSDTSRHRVGPAFQSNVPRRHERFDVGPTFQADSPRRHSFDPSRHRVGPTLQSHAPRRHERFDAGSTFQTDSPRRHSFDPSRHRVGPTYQSDVPRAGPSTVVHDSWDTRKYYIQRSQFLENNDNHQADDKEVNISDGNRGYEKTSSGKYYFDASDGDEEDMAQGS